MRPVDFTRAADRDLSAIRHRLTQEAGPGTALTWVRRLSERALSLSETPERGALDSELGRRRLVVRPYLIFYDIRQNGRVTILRIIDGRRDLDPLLRRS